MRKAFSFSHRLTQSPLIAESSVTDTFSDTQASVLIGTAEKMIDLWERLSPEKQALLLKRFGLFGPPGIIFFDAAGAERKGLRVVGFMKAEPFATVLERAL